MLEDASIRPYFIRAVYDWCADKGCTPYLLANWSEENSGRIPPQLVSNGKIVFNISDEAVRRLAIDEHGVSFTGRFLGRTVEVHVPLRDILSIYARERQAGLAFPPLAEEADSADAEADATPAPTAPARKSSGKQANAKASAATIIDADQKKRPSATKSAKTAKAAKPSKPAKRAKGDNIRII